MAEMEHHRYPFKALDAACDIQLFAASRDDAAHASGLAIGEITRVDANYSLRSASIVAAINRAAAAGQSITVNEETASLIDHAANAFAESGGAFDITAAPLRKLWDLDHGVAPDAGELARVMEKIGWQKVRWEKPVLSFPVAGMAIDFGLFVRAYAIDRAANALRAAGIEHGIVNAGGDVHVVGPRADGEGWTVGLRRPVADGMVSLIAMRAGSLATSGDWERTVTIGSETFGRMLNPKTGWPVKGVAQVSGMADLCVTAATVAAIAMLKEGEGAAWVAKSGFAHLVIDVNDRPTGTLYSATGYRIN